MGSSLPGKSLNIGGFGGRPAPARLPPWGLGLGLVVILIVFKRGFYSAHGRTLGFTESRGFQFLPPPCLARAHDGELCVTVIFALTVGSRVATAQTLNAHLPPVGFMRLCMKAGTVGLDPGAREV